MTTTLITGATRGLGKETARQLVEAGHTVWIGARDADQGAAVAAEIGARSVQLDVRDDDSVAAAFAHVDANGGLDVLVNNAGIAVWGQSGPDALAVFDTNAVGIVRTTEAALPILRRSASPLVVNVGSALGSFTAVHDPDSAASTVLSPTPEMVTATWRRARYRSRPSPSSRTGCAARTRHTKSSV